MMDQFTRRIGRVTIEVKGRLEMVGNQCLFFGEGLKSGFPLQNRNISWNLVLAILSFTVLLN